MNVSMNNFNMLLEHAYKHVHEHVHKHVYEHLLDQSKQIVQCDILLF